MRINVETSIRVLPTAILAAAAWALAWLATGSIDAADWLPYAFLRRAAARRRARRRSGRGAPSSELVALGCPGRARGLGGDLDLLVGGALARPGRWRC